jgi:ATP-dependent Clp protease ATP-binding subunit ClpC
MFERYTEKARRSVFLARYEATQFGSQYIGTEHLLLGILREDKAIAAQLLGSLRAIEEVRKQIEENVPTGKKISTTVDLPLSKECKRALATAADEANRLNHKTIDSVHLFLGLLLEEASLASRILKGHGVVPESVREVLTDLPRWQPEQASEARFLVREVRGSLLVSCRSCGETPSFTYMGIREGMPQIRLSCPGCDATAVWKLPSPCVGFPSEPAKS